MGMAVADADQGLGPMRAMITTAVVSCGAAMLLPSPAAAQERGAERFNVVIAFSEEECPAARDQEVVICEILVEEERYRIPSSLRFSESPQNVSWSRRVDKIRYVGEFGTMSCSPAGAGGITGCTQQFINDWAQDRSEAEQVRFGQIIDQARRERLGEIDQDAAEEQSRVEMIEREYMQRLERERSGELPGTATTPASEDEALPPLTPRG
jgi:hypothetical protein